MRALILILILAVIGWLLLLRDPAGPSVGDGGGMYTRLTLTHVAPQPEPKTTPLETFAPRRGLESWEGKAAKRVTYNTTKPREADYDPEAPLEPQRIPAILLQGPGAKLVRVPGKFDPRTFSQVMLLMANHGRAPESVRVVFELEGRNAISSPWLAVPTSKSFAQPVVFDLPQARRAGRALDALRVEFKGNGTDLVTVNRVELWHRPARAFLPAPGGEGRLVTINGEARRGVGLSSRAPLEVTFQVPTQGELAFSHGLAEELRVFGEDPKLRLTLTCGDLDPITATYSLESQRNERSLWHSESLDLSVWSGREARAKFELEVKGGHVGLAVLAEPAISRRGQVVPTVTLITSDTHRGDHLSSAGDLVTTPVLDALAGRGVQFDNTFAATNITNPSHVSLMTATSPRDTHILNNNTPLSGEALTLAECFAAAGYRTYAAVSAYHLLDSESGLGQGFDRLNGPLVGERDGANTLDILEEWLREAAGQPLFTWLHLFDAHAPYKPVTRYAQRYWDGADPYGKDTPVDMPDVEVPGFLRGLKVRDYPYAMYRGEVDYVDELMGRFLGAERIGAGVIAFTSDHGESFGEHGVWWDHADLYPETVHVPLILAWPGGMTGIRTDQPVEQTDIGRTLLDLSGLEEASFPGRNLLWAIEDPGAAQARFSISAHGFVASVTSGSWQLHLHDRRHKEWAIETWREAHQVELYNLAEDPKSANDLAKDPAHFERARKLRRRLIDWLNSGSAKGLGTSKVLTEDALQSLQAMGYAGGESQAPAYVSEPETNGWDAYFDDH